MPLAGRLDAQAGQKIPCEIAESCHRCIYLGFENRTRNSVWRNFFSCTLAPIADSGYVNLYGKDITERKRSEQVLAEFARQQQALYQLSDQLHRANSFEDVYNAALDAILNGLQSSRASILLFDDTGVIRFAAWRGLSDEYRKATEGHSLWSANEKNPYPICVSDFVADLEIRSRRYSEGRIGALLHPASRPEIDWEICGVF
jgi:hypothetical protein